VLETPDDQVIIFENTATQNTWNAVGWRLVIHETLYDDTPSYLSPHVSHDGIAMDSFFLRLPYQLLDQTSFGTTPVRAIRDIIAGIRDDTFHRD